MLNAQGVQAREALADAELMKQFASSYEKAIELIEGLSDEQLAQRRRFGALEAPIADLLDSFLILHGLSHVYHAQSRPLN